jgi:hypothetical protein
MTVRFTYRGGHIRIFGAGYWRKEKSIYDQKHRGFRVIDDFLPVPADLVAREDNVKVTLSLSRRSLDYFKREARRRHVPY